MKLWKSQPPAVLFLLGRPENGFEILAPLRAGGNLQLHDYTAWAHRLTRAHTHTHTHTHTPICTQQTHTEACWLQGKRHDKGIVYTRAGNYIGFKRLWVITTVSIVTLHNIICSVLNFKVFWFSVEFSKAWDRLTLVNVWEKIISRLPPQ